MNSPQELAATIPMPPKDKAANLDFRRKVAERGGNDDRWAQAFVLRGAADPVWWIDAWGWTQNPKDFPQELHQPLILFPERQEPYIRCLHDHVERGKPLLVVKSREQLATIGTANYAAWRWANCTNAAVKIGSTKQELVDGDSFADQIMPKIDYTLKLMPRWALPDGFSLKKPGTCRKFMLLRNPVTGAPVKGEATNANFSVSGRYAWVWLDETARVKNLETMHAAVAGTTNCFVYTSTPFGYEEFARMVHSGKHDVFRLHWTTNRLWHPHRHKPEECDWENRIWPKNWVCSPGCPIHEDGGWPHSEKYDNECDKWSWNPRLIAQELDMNFHKSGRCVFPVDTVQRVIDTLRDNPPKIERIELLWDTRETAWNHTVTDDPDSWFHATKAWKVIAATTAVADKMGVDHRKRYPPLQVFEKPDPTCIYCVGGDTSRGLAHGDYDCVPVWNVTKGRTVAELHCKLGAQRIGIISAMICRWYGLDSGCAENAYGSPEWNQNGAIVADVMNKMGIWLAKSRSENAKSRAKTKATYLGVLIPPRHKRRFLDEYLVPLIEEVGANGLPVFVDPFIAFWEECLGYVELPAASTVANPDTVKVGAPHGFNDDRVAARLAMVVGASRRWGKISGNKSRLLPPKKDLLLPHPSDEDAA